MFRKEIFNQLASIQRRIDDIFSNKYKIFEQVKTKQGVLEEDFSNIKKTINRDLDKNVQIIQSQQKTIEQLTKALCDKYEHGLFVYSEDGKRPTVIRNGQVITNDLTTSFCVDWSMGENFNIHTEQIGSTWENDENMR